MAELKTFLFTDIVGSVELKRTMPGHSDAERDQAFIEQILSPHRARIELNLAAHGGRVVSTAGDGHFLVFSDTVLAARWAIGIQQSHRDEPIRTPDGDAVAVRISMHSAFRRSIRATKTISSANRSTTRPGSTTMRPADRFSLRAAWWRFWKMPGWTACRFIATAAASCRGIGAVDIYELVYDGSGPRKMRPQPRESALRQWTVLPAEMGLSELQARGGTSPTIRPAC